MINLIPNEEKKAKVKDFYFRLLVVFFTVIGFALIISSVAILPSYFVSSVNRNLMETRLADQQKEVAPLPDQEALKTVNDVKNKLTLAETNEKNKYLISKSVINEIVLNKMSDIKITALIYDTSKGSKTVTVSGVAPSRERLLLFRQALEDDFSFKKVDLPISNFVKGSNIQFSLVITLS